MEFKVTVETEEGLSISETINFTADVVLIKTRIELEEYIIREIKNKAVIAIRKIINICNSGKWLQHVKPRFK